MRPAAVPRERGSALVAALLFAIVVLAFAVSVIMGGVAVSDQERGLVAAQRAHDAAESGVHHLLAGLAGSQRPLILAQGGLEGVLQGNAASSRALRYAVSIRPAGDDNADNDLDGAVDEEDEDEMYEVESVGSVDGATRTVRVTLVARYRTPALNAATYIEDPGADLALNGNAFLISGRDVDLAGNPTGALVPGIGVAGDPTFIRSQVSRKQDDNVVGLGGNLSVHAVESIDWDQLVTDAVRSANVTLSGKGTQKPASPGAWGTLDQPVVVFGSGSIHISGAGGGAGALIVDGDLTITGQFEWHGLIIVRGSVRFSGGGSTKRVIGGVVVRRHVRGEADDDGRDIGVSGTVDLLFSQATLLRVSRIFATYTVVNWREGPNPPEAGS